MKKPLLRTFWLIAFALALPALKDLLHHPDIPPREALVEALASIGPASVPVLTESLRHKDAHAWVELAGVDVGPPPGRNGHVELARYP